MKYEEAVKHKCHNIALMFNENTKNISVICQDCDKVLFNKEME